MKFKITYLKDYPEFIPTVAKWVYEEWADKNKKSLKQVIQEFENYCNKDKIPIAFVAVDRETPVGLINIWENDLDSKEDLTPWVAAFYVIPEYRNKGVGKALMEKALGKAREMRFKIIYLHAETAGEYYQKLGWKLIEDTINDKGEASKLFKYEL
ncbi:MAG: GNAT family N-acetyltransferase [Patescibacteria group bacterium]|nr:GNAT family N-acetyltransferase [Patescibacteria group bacterium]